MEKNEVNNQDPMIQAEIESGDHRSDSASHETESHDDSIRPITNSIRRSDFFEAEEDWLR